MAKHPLWNDEYWLLLLQLYQEKPMGVKPLYSKGIVDLSLELHIQPEYLRLQMFKLQRADHRIKRLWDKYANNPTLLAHDIETLRKMYGCGNARDFFEGVEVKETFEKDWEPLAAEPALTPVKLIIILDLYFQLTPVTMVAETPEIIDLAKLLGISPKLVAEVMTLYQYCDPYLNRPQAPSHELLPACDDIWHRYGNGNPDKLNQLALSLQEYFKPEEKAKEKPKENNKKKAPAASKSEAATAKRKAAPTKSKAAPAQRKKATNKSKK